MSRGRTTPFVGRTVPPEIDSERTRRCHSRQFPGSCAVNSYRLEKQSLSGSSNEMVSYCAPTRQLTVTREGVTETRTETPFDYLDLALRTNRPDPSLPFGGGYVGYFGYELRSDCGSLVTHPSPFPDAMLLRIEDRNTPALAPAVKNNKKSPARPRLSRPEYLDSNPAMHPAHPPWRGLPTLSHQSARLRNGSSRAPILRNIAPSQSCALFGLSAVWRAGNRVFLARMLSSHRPRRPGGVESHQRHPTARPHAGRPVWREAARPVLRLILRWIGAHALCSMRTASA